MSRDNDVFKMLVTKGNKAVLGPDLNVDDLTDGQIGVFDADTNLSINGDTLVAKFYLAVGVAPGGTLENIRKSAGNEIQTRHLNDYNFYPHSAGRPMIVEVGGFTSVKCDTDYSIKIEYFNSKIWRNQGFTPFSHSFTVTTGCCVDCTEDCNTADANELIWLFANRINGSKDQLVKAEVITIGALVVATHGTSQAYAAGAVITKKEDVDALIAFNKEQADDADKVYTKLRLTSKPIPMSTSVAGIDLKYYNQRETTMVVSFAHGFNCGGTITTTQEAAFEQGNGYDIQQREYQTHGWEGSSGVYRTSSVTGLPWGTSKFYANADAKYDKIILEYQHEAQGGWLDYKNELATEIVIPEADTTTRNGLLTLLDKIASKVGKSPQADDGLDASTNPAVVEEPFDED